MSLLKMLELDVVAVVVPTCAGKTLTTAIPRRQVIVYADQSRTLIASSRYPLSVFD